MSLEGGLAVARDTAEATSDVSETVEYTQPGAHRAPALRGRARVVVRVTRALGGGGGAGRHERRERSQGENRAEGWWTGEKERRARRGGGAEEEGQQRR